MNDNIICRACLATNVKVYRLCELTTFAAYTQLTGVEDLGLHPYICYECAARLRKMEEFQSNCLKALEILPNKQIPEEKETDRKLKCLKSPLQLKVFDVIECSGIDISNEPEDSVKVETINAYYNNENFIIQEHNMIECKSHESDAEYKNSSHEFDGNSINSYNSDITEEKHDIQDIIAESEKHKMEQTKMSEQISKEVDTDCKLEDSQSPMQLQVFDTNEIVIISDEVEKEVETINQYYNNENCIILEYVGNIETNDLNVEDKRLLIEFDKDSNKSVMDENLDIQDVIVKNKKRKIDQTKKSEASCESDFDDDLASYESEKIENKKLKLTIEELKEYATFTTMTPEEANREVDQRKESNDFMGSPFKCYHGFLTENTYDNHLILHHSVANGKYECEFCLARFSKKNILTNHININHKLKISCTMCPHVSFTAHQAKVHMKSHQGVTDTCDQDPKSFSSPRSLLSHKRLSHPTNSICAFCGDNFVNDRRLKSHIARAHKKEQNATRLGPSCDQCNVHFATETAFKRHLVLTEKHQVSVVVQDICDLPEGRELETPLHPKKMRTWSPSKPRTPPKRPIAPSLSSSSVSSPAKSVKHELLPPPQSPRRPHKRHGTVNDGSEEDESEDEEGTDFFGIPRVYQGYMDTPLDQDYEDVSEVAPLAVELATADDQVSLTETEQPWSWSSFEWREFPIAQIRPESRRETFSEINVGPTTPREDPYDIFVDIWDRNIMEHIASETNRYAQQVVAQMMNDHILSPKSRISKWHDTTVDEIYVYFGLILSMGNLVKSRLEEYWSSTPDIFYTPGFSAHMSIDRFLLISRCIHFNNNEDMCALNLGFSEAKLSKIQPILTHLNNKFQQLYTPSQNIALDESLLMWKGRLEMNQLIRSKAAKQGIKSYEICESQTGYLWRFEVHTPKQSLHKHLADPLEAPTPSIVLKLTQGLEHKGYTLWMDSYYNSPCLARRLKSMGFDCVGTLRTDRKFVPESLHSLTKRNMRTGQVAGLTSGDVDVMVWKDQNRVAMISTYHGNGQRTVHGSTKPIVILDYNIMMGGVDKKDQLLALYPVERKRTRVWYKKLFRRLLNISVLNSYIIYHHSCSTLSHRNFRVTLIKSLLAKHSPLAVVRPVPVVRDKPDISHRLTELPWSGRQRARRVCSVCKKKISTLCVGCGKTVCMEPCFVTLHSELYNNFR